jgi:carbamoyltransferase
VKIILGISAYFHDAAAAILVDGEIIAAAQEERFTRQKNTADFPSNAILYCLEEAGISLHQVDAIVFYEKPFLKFERLLETYYRNAPKGFLSFLKAMPQWLETKLGMRGTIKKELKKIDPTYKKQKRLLFSGHHLSHAASAFYPSGFEKATVLVIDAVGEWSTATIWKGQGTELTLLRELKFPDSLGLLYSAFTYFLGFKVNNGEYKLMGLAPYGNPEDAQTWEFERIIKTKLVEIFDDGSIQLIRDAFSFEYGLKMVSDKKWEKLFGFKKRNSEEPIHQNHANLALAIQNISEEIILKMARAAREITGMENLCLAGGVALNCVANGKIQEVGLFKNIWVQPAAGDAGGALGAALAYYYSKKEEKERIGIGKDAMKNALLGPMISKEEVVDFCKKEKLSPLKFETTKEKNAFIIAQILQDKVIGWVQGRMEFGPRALGARSILANPASPDMQRKLNLKVKFREDFRPFAPVMLKEEALKYFDCDFDAAYMQFVKKLKPEFRKDLPENFSKLNLNKKLDSPRSKFQAISHVDFSARLQVVEDKKHPLYELLLEMRTQSGDAILINTSFNTNGEPIVCSLADAWHCFNHTNIDILCVGNYVFQKTTS